MGPPKCNKRRSLQTTSTETNPNDTAFFEALMSDPIKRNFVLQLLSQEKETIAEYKRNEVLKLHDNSEASPLKKLKKKPICESPTALMRRRALEKQLQGEDNQYSGSERAESSQSELEAGRSSSPCLLPYNELLKDVVAYVEIRSKDADRSAGAKALMLSMGATIRGQFTSDVTHVVFKDGSFTTYQKAKLLKVHMVSVLWLEAVRRTHCRVPEKNYPALGTERFDTNVSAICSQLQKEYEDVVKEDIRRSLSMGTPLPSPRTLLSDRRRTICTPQHYSSSFRLSQELPSSTQDKEVDSIMSRKLLKTIFETSKTPSVSSSVLASPSPEITSDGSDCGIVDGDFSSSRRRDTIILETPDIPPSDYMAETPELITRTVKVNETRFSNSDMITTPVSHRISDNSVSDNSKSLIGGPTKSNQNISDMEITKNVTTASKETDESTVQKATDNISSDKSTNISSENISLRKSNVKVCKPRKRKSKTDKENNSSESLVTNMSSLQITSANLVTDNNSKGQEDTRSSTGSKMSSLQISGNTENNMPLIERTINLNSEQSKSDAKCTNDSTMSSLRISSDGANNKNSVKQCFVNCSVANNLTKDTSGSTMSSLRISSEPKNVKTENKVAKRSSSSSMSILRISNESRELNMQSKLTDKSSSTMSSLRISDELQQAKTQNLLLEDNKTSRNISGTSSPVNIEAKANDNFVTRRTRRSITLGARKEKDEQNVKRTELRKTQNIQSKRASASEWPNSTNKTASNHLNNESSKPDKKTRVNHKEDEQVDKAPTEFEKSISKTNSPGNDSGSGSADSNNSSKNTKRARKLYNPDDSINKYISSSQMPCDEKERMEKRKRIKRKLQDEFVDPNLLNLVPIVLSARAKKCQKSIQKSSLDSSTDDLEDISPAKTNKQKKRVRRKSSRKVVRDSSADEQKELAAEFVEKKKSKKETPDKSKKINKVTKDTTQTDKFKMPVERKKGQHLTEPGSCGSRKSARLTQRSKKVDSKTPLPNTPVQNRRSSLEFQSCQTMSSTKKKQKTIVRLPSIVCTKLHKDDCILFHQVVKKLGRFVVEDEVSDRSTHLVAGEAKRTINMLRAIARGCWILKHEWLLSSLENGKWLPEEDYEVTEFSPAVQHCRLERQAFGESYSMDVFQECGSIYIARSSIPRCSDLQELVTLCKGTITTILRNAKIIVGEYVDSKDVNCVTETWILDCITFNKRKSLKKYLLEPLSKKGS